MTRRMTQKLRLMTALIAATAALALLAAPAGAQVLVNALPSSVACGKPIRVGVWYQSFSGGPRWAKISIRSLSGTLLKHRTVTATTTWRYWNYTMPCGRTYRVRYVTASGTVNYTVKVRS